MRRLLRLYENTVTLLCRVSMSISRCQYTGHPRVTPSWMPRQTERSFFLQPWHCDLKHFPLFSFTHLCKTIFIVLLCFLLFTIPRYLRTFLSKYAMYLEHISLHSSASSLFSSSFLPLVFFCPHRQFCSYFNILLHVSV